MSGVQGRVYAITSLTEPTEQPFIQGTFLLSRLWESMLFDSGALHSFCCISCDRVRLRGLISAQKVLF